MPQARFLVKCHFLFILFRLIYSQHVLSHYISSLSPSYIYLSKRQYPELVSEPEAPVQERDWQILGAVSEGVGHGG